jgi:molybdopterin synthase sulfur carrier subunit
LSAVAIDLLYFAWVREAIGVGAEQVDPPVEVTSVADLITWLAGRSDGHARAFADKARLRAAVDQRFVPLDAALGTAREVALFPPVTGG